MKPQRIAVVGMGLLGRGIAACFLGHGFEVVAFARQEQGHEAVRKHIGIMMEELVKFGGCDKDLSRQWTASFALSADYSSLRDCLFVVESVAEDIAVKNEVFDQIEAQVASDVVISSNSSAIPITALQRQRKHPHRFLALHWAEPAHATRFMEIIRGEQTSEPTVETALALACRLGKEPSVLQKEVPGFIANRIGYAMYREAMSLLEAGVADAETIDRSVRNALGLWATVCGPFRWIDLTGGPELYAKAMQHVLPTLNCSAALAAPMQKLAASGARGIANGRGFFNYTPEDAKRWEELYRRHAWRVAQMQDEYAPKFKDPMNT